ncbi:MAG: hypothetical protein EBT09_04575, partial [Actinobacteria bacterium]|nr:hypothetical protein [Actinomycetota bacterium]
MRPGFAEASSIARPPKDEDGGQFAEDDAKGVRGIGGRRFRRSEGSTLGNIAGVAVAVSLGGPGAVF